MYLVYSIFFCHFVYLEHWFKFPATCVHDVCNNDDHFHSSYKPTLWNNSMAFSTILSVVSASLLLVCGGRLLYEQYYGKQNCEMTYMYFYPQYQVGTVMLYGTEVNQKLHV